MADSSLNSKSYSNIVDEWLRKEKEGNKYPVDLDEAWEVAGYATKASAKRAIDNYLEKETDYLFNKMLKSTGGRGSEVINLTCDALKELCMLSRSAIGKNTRKYFIEAEKALKEVSSLMPKTYKEALLALIAQEEEKERLALENELKQSIIEDQEKDLERQAEVIDELFDYSSIIRIAKFNNISEKNFSWRRLKAVSEKMNLEIKKVPSARYAYQLLYPHDAWRFAYPNVKLPETTTLTIIK
jgi:phage anti-repressor protein